MKTNESEKMRIILNESDYAFQIIMNTGGSPNTDYAQYASDNFIQSFRHVLQKPDLSRAQLSSMLRQAERRRRRRGDDVQWSDFMAGMVSKQANSNALSA